MRALSAVEILIELHCVADLRLEILPAHLIAVRTILLKRLI